MQALLVVANELERHTAVVVEHLLGDVALVKHHQVEGFSDELEIPQALNRLSF